MERFVKTWWRHTDKAVWQGESRDRRFAVVGVLDGWLSAWKVEDLGGGWVYHPAYCGGKKCPTRVRLVDIDPFPAAGANGSRPTALFRPDSLYIMCL